MRFSWRTSGLWMFLIYKCKMSKYFNYVCLNVSDFKTKFQSRDPMELILQTLNTITREYMLSTSVESLSPIRPIMAKCPRSERKRSRPFS